MTGLLVVGLLLAAQSGGATVGDTVWITHTVAVPAGVSVRPRPIAATPEVEPLGPPEVVLRDQAAVLRYPVVAWRTGRHTVGIPGPILVRDDGWSDTLAAARAQLEIRSVLPALPAGARDTLAPRPPAPTVPAGTRSWLPAAVLLAAAALGLLPLHRWWRRRGTPTPRPDPARRHPEVDQLARWLAAGEVRAARDGGRALVLATLPEGPARDGLLARIETGRFGPQDPAEANRILAEVRRAAGVPERPG